MTNAENIHGGITGSSKRLETISMADCWRTGQVNSGAVRQ